MEGSYISNIDEYDDDLAILDKVNQLEIENEKYKNEINELEKVVIDQKNIINDLQIDNDANLVTIKNQMGLIKFYKDYRKEHEDNQDQKKLEEYQEKIKSLEESNSIKNRRLEDLQQELDEQSSLNEKLVDVITQKEETIKKLERGENDNTENSGMSKLEEEIENLKNKISDLESEKEKITDKYEDKINALNKENNNYQDKIYDYETEILNLKEMNKKYEIEEAKKKGGMTLKKK